MDKKYDLKPLPRIEVRGVSVGPHAGRSQGFSLNLDMSGLAPLLKVLAAVTAIAGVGAGGFYMLSPKEPPKEVLRGAAQAIFQKYNLADSYNFKGYKIQLKKNGGGKVFGEKLSQVVYGIGIVASPKHDCFVETKNSQRTEFDEFLPSCVTDAEIADAQAIDQKAKEAEKLPLMKQSSVMPPFGRRIASAMTLKLVPSLDRDHPLKAGTDLVWKDRLVNCMAGESGEWQCGEVEGQ